MTQWITNSDLSSRPDQWSVIITRWWVISDLNQIIWWSDSDHCSDHSCDQWSRDSGFRKFALHVYLSIWWCAIRNALKFFKFSVWQSHTHGSEQVLTTHTHNQVHLKRLYYKLCRPIIDLIQQQIIQTREKWLSNESSVPIMVHFIVMMCWLAVWLNFYLLTKMHRSYVPEIRRWLIKPI